MTQEALATQGALADSDTWGALKPANDPLGAFRALLRAQATYAWFGPDATLAAWPDAVAGVNAAPGGSGTTLGTLSGVACPLFARASWYRTGSFVVAAPFVAIFVAQRDTTVALLGNDMHIIDGATTTTRLRAYVNVSGASPDLTFYGGAFYASAFNVETPGVIKILEDGASSEVSRNGVSSGTITLGSEGIDGITIGARPATLNDRAFSGEIALVAIVSGANYVARAASIEAAARALFGV